MLHMYLVHVLTVILVPVFYAVEANQAGLYPLELHHIPDNILTLCINPINTVHVVI